MTRALSLTYGLPSSIEICPQTLRAEAGLLTHEAVQSPPRRAVVSAARSLPARSLMPLSNRLRLQFFLYGGPAAPTHKTHNAYYKAINSRPFPDHPGMVATNVTL